MPEIIQDWLGTRLGVVIDMTPERFGRVTKDGKLLANLLYNYGIIPKHILNNVKESKNYYECLNNLIVLKPWLKHIGVIQDDSTYERMASGEGSASISLFYSVYLHLEQKDRLHYLSAQKERRVSELSCDKFKVSWVPERFISTQETDGLKLAAPIYENCEMIDWHKAKCEQIVEQIKKTKAKFRKVCKKKKELGPLISKHTSSTPLDKQPTGAGENPSDKANQDECRDLTFSELKEMKKLFDMQPPFVPSMEEAKNMVDNIKRLKKGEVYSRNFQHKMQDILLEEQWKEMIEKQEEDFEKKVCANLLKQSQYEKQMMTKLSLLRNQKRVLAENRRKIECLKIDQCQKEYDETVQRNMELRGEYGEEDEIEKERIAELHRRLYDEKVRIRKEMIKAESQKIYEAMVDIAIRIGEYRELIGSQIPKSIMKDLKELFYKGLPIFDLLDHLEDLCVSEKKQISCVCWDKEELGEEEEEEEEEGEDKINFKKLKAEEAERQSVLDECDFKDYLYLMGPWMVELLFPDISETEVKPLVLGYIVHKILAVKYPSPNAPAPVYVKPMKPTSVVHGLNDESALNMLTDLMEACGILVVKVEDAINFVLLAYKEELSVVRDIDITFQNITDEALSRKSSDEKEREMSRKMQLLKVECSEMSGEEFILLDKAVQTPRMIPEDDPLFSPNAELGKLAFEALGAGDPVPDTVIASALVAYVVSKQDFYDGLVILDYPQLYSQASELEYFFTGYRTLPLLDEMDTLEDVEEFSYRGPWGNPSKDIFGEARTSKLVPKPEIFVPIDREIPKTYFDSIIKLKKEPSSSRRRPDQQSYYSDEFNPMDQFYSDLCILFNFEYQNLNFQTVKNLGKQILGVMDNVSDLDVIRKTSEEVFGSVIFELNDKWDQKRKPVKDNTGGMKKMASQPKVGSFEMESKEISGEDEVEMERPGTPHPGDPTWVWATGDQPEEFLTALASVWENMEAIYIEDFKSLFFCLRVHRLNLTNYCGYIRKSLRMLMRRPDEKQKVLSDFQQMFNEIDEDLRPDRDIKCELHVRVSELEQALMAMADERKRNSLKDATAIAQDGWVPDEMANLVNVFLAALQLEADRTIDSCQVITDYYTSLQQKVPEVKPIGKVAVPKLRMQDRKYSVSSSFSNKLFSWGSPRASDTKRKSSERQSKTKSVMDRRRRSSESLAGAAEFITDILTNLSLPEDGLTPFHMFFTDSIQLITAEVRNTLENCLAEARKTAKSALNETRQTKNSKKPSETTVVPTNENLMLEWTTALQNEISRFSFRSQLILARGIFDMSEFLAMILNLLSSLSEEITEMYLKEIESISECCKVFRCGIEREIGIKPTLVLKLEEFFVYMNDSESRSEEILSTQSPDEDKRFTFTFDQLNLLFDKLQKVAPDGEIIKRSLVYIFEDLRMLNSEIENCKCFPEIWNDIEPNDVTTVMNEVFQNLEIVHWKDFIIYALNVPLPSEAEILSMRQIFRKFDPFVTELVTREHYDCVTLWFEKFTDEEDMERSNNAKDFLYRMYQVNDLQTNYSALLLAFCKDENPVVGFEKALALAMGKSIRQYMESSRESYLGETRSYDLGLFDDTYRETPAKLPCCPTSSTEVKLDCIPKEKIVRCECKEPEKSVEESTTSDTEQNILEEEDAGEAKDFIYGSKDLRSVASVIPFNILTSLLKASFPSLPQLSILLDCDQTFQETINAIYDSAESYDNTLEVQKLLGHKFIQRLLHSTNKFKFVKLKPILVSLTKDKSPASRTQCVTEKPNIISCLRN